MSHRRTVSSRTQTLVQLTDGLVDALDRRAAAAGLSRSALIRRLLEGAMQADLAAEVSRRMIEGYRRHPQSIGRDAWGDLDRWTELNTRRNLAALGDEEAAPW